VTDRGHASDSDLVQRLARHRDSRAFEALYARHANALYATALRLTDDRDAAFDASHDAWVRAVERLGSFEHRSSFRTWLTGILINVVRERWRGERELPIDVVGEIASAEPIASMTDPIDLENAIAALPPRFRTVLVLHDVDGFTHEEIAAMLGIVPGTSKSQLARARQRVRAHLTKPMERKSS
jgi:RNA polymerase sigma-70 factor (ECF subfamily)